MEDRLLTAAELADKREDLYVLLARVEGTDMQTRILRFIRVVEARLDQVARAEERRRDNAP